MYRRRPRLIRHTGGRNWAGFQFEDDGRSWALDDEMARAALPARRHRHSGTSRTSQARGRLVPDPSGSHPSPAKRPRSLRPPIYIEERPASELAFASGATVERQVVPKVMEVGLACDPKNRMVEICARGGKRVRDQYAAAFARHFAPHTPPPVETPRREVSLDTLAAAPGFRDRPRRWDRGYRGVLA